MKMRIISATFGLAFLFFVLCFYNTIILNLAVALVCSIMVFEVFRTTKILEQSFFAFIVCEIFCIAYSFLKISKIDDTKDSFLIGYGKNFFRISRTINMKDLCLIGYGVIFLFFLFKNYKTIKIENLIFTFSFSMFLTLSTNVLLGIRTNFKPYGIYYTLLLFSVAWVCDTGAYFIGMRFGKNKLAPQISPKKTIEGAVGGVVFSFIVIFTVSLAYFKFFCDFKSINYFSLVFVILVGSIFAILGDLSMSMVKRSYEIKDFGNIMRGHGGILDRFDSWIFVSVVTYPWLLHFPIIGLV